MNYLKYTQYAYLLAAVLFIGDGFTKLNKANETPYLSFSIAAVSIFMFFFRRKFAKKFEENNNK